MRKLKITVLDRAEIGDILEPDETLLWTGQPGYGRKLFQILGPERYWHLGLAGGIFALWASVPFIDPDTRPCSLELKTGVATKAYMLCRARIR